MKEWDPAGLDCLAALVDEGSFERAAQRLSITQSAVSQRVRSLEAQMGQLLVIRSRPLQLTEPGLVLLRYARQLQALRADVARELGSRVRSAQRLPIAVNADSLATWVLPALDPLVQKGLSLELIVDDQDFTHERLRQGAVLGCVSTVSEALRGCSVTPLGVMRYQAVASPSFLARELPQGLNRGNFSRVPFLVFNRKDDMQQSWVAKAFDVREPRLLERFVPSSEASLRAAQMGWGVAVAAELQSRVQQQRGELCTLLPQISVAVALYWHQWKLGSDASGVPGGSESARGGWLDEVGAALAGYSAQVLEPCV
jgi:LysR family transcriptional regulator (chromosome initiation inhibitor)